MYRLRKEDISVYLYIKDIVLKPFIEKQEGEELVYIPEVSTESTYVYGIETYAQPNPFDRGRGIVYFDDDFDECLVNCATCSGNPEQSNRVVVYDEFGNIIPDTDYMIDYVDGRIVTNNVVKPRYIDYYWNYVSVVDEWNVVEAADAPVVVVDIHGTDKKGYQLGGGKQIFRKLDLHVFASSPAERNDILEVLYDGLDDNSCPLYELPTGTVLDFDGTFYGRRSNINKDETLFSRATVSGSTNLRFDYVSSRNINLPLTMAKGADDIMLSDLNAYRARITCDLTSYT
jgi:hypothetical protein